MADEDEHSLLARYRAQKRRVPGSSTVLSETAAIALDVSAMMAYVAPLFELISDTPAIRDGPNGPAIRSLLTDLRQRSEAHIEAMAEMSRDP